VSGYIGRAGSGIGAFFDKWIHFASSAVPDVDFKSGFEQVAYHSLPHDAQSDKSNYFAHFSSPWFVPKYLQEFSPADTDHHK
jgi:hypothetical protein